MYANVLRAGTLNDERVIHLVSANFVPTHFNNNDPTRDKSDPSLALWKSITGQKPLQGQGIWIVSPDGKAIAGMSAEVNGLPSERVGNGPGAPWGANPRFADAAVEMLEQTLQKLGPLAPRTAKAKPLPFRGAGIMPDGGVRLVVYNRADNGLVFSVILDKNDWAQLAPPKFEKGIAWPAPPSLARKFGPVLSPFADTRFRPRVDDVRSANLWAEVEAIDRGQVRIRLTGHWQVDWVHDNHEHSVGAATAEGIAIYDIEKKSMRSLLMIFDGTYGYTTSEKQPPRPQATAAVVRWRLDGDAE